MLRKPEGQSPRFPMDSILQLYKALKFFNCFFSFGIVASLSKIIIAVSTELTNTSLNSKVLSFNDMSKVYLSHSNDTPFLIVSNPTQETTNVYFPSGISSIVYTPYLSAAASLASSLTLTVEKAMALPLQSVTLPVIVAARTKLGIVIAKRMSKFRTIE